MENDLNDLDDDIIFEELPPVYKPFVRSTKHQRELLERLANRKGLHYHGLIRKCNESLGKQIRDIGELSLGEADKIIKELGGLEK